MPNTKPPLELDAEVETHDGTLYRWDPTSRLASRRPQGQSFSTQRGEGFGPGAVSLTRDVMKDHEDLNLLDTLRFIGKNGEVAYEGRVHHFARTNDPMQQFAISSIGWYSTAKFRKFSEIYIDRALGKFGDPSTQRKTSVLKGGSFDFAKVNVSQAGAGAGASGPAVLFEFPQWGPLWEIGESWYFGEGTDIGVFRYDFIAPRAGGEPEGTINIARLSTDDLQSAFVEGTNHKTTPAANQSLSADGPGYKYIELQSVFTGAATGASNGDTYGFANPRTIGRHGLTLQGSQPDEGIVSSDILAHIFNNFTPLTWDGEATTYPIKQAAFQSQYPADAAALLNDYHLWEIGCFEDKKVFYYPADLTTYDWQIRTDDPGVRFNPLQGDSIDGFANGVEVTFTDFSGRTRTMYPSEHSELRDETESNPANLHGDQLWKDFTVPYPTTEADALQIGRVYLAEYNRPKSPGTINIAGGYVKDGAGHWQQGWKVRCGETISLTNHPNDAPRLITSTPSWDQDSKVLTVSVDNGYQLLEAFIARMANAREAANRN